MTNRIEKLLPAVHDDLQRLASNYLQSGIDDYQIGETELVNQAYLKLIDSQETEWKNRAHFFAVASNAMRRVLVEHFRKRKTEHIDDATSISDDRFDKLVNLDKALERLSLLDKRQAQIVELRFFGGLTFEETAESLDIALATAKRDWFFAKAWLQRELEGKLPSPILSRQGITGTFINTTQPTATLDLMVSEDISPENLSKLLFSLNRLHLNLLAEPLEIESIKIGDSDFVYEGQSEWENSQ